MRHLSPVFTIALLFAADVAAQSPASPLDPAAPTPPLKYESAFRGYRAFEEAEVKSWRELNNTVRSVGGHAGSLPAKLSAPSQSRPADVPPASSAPVPRPENATPADTPAAGRKP